MVISQTITSCKFEMIEFENGKKYETGDIYTFFLQEMNLKHKHYRLS